jgi:hypothetical protein
MAFGNLEREGELPDRPTLLNVVQEVLMDAFQEQLISGIDLLGLRIPGWTAGLHLEFVEQQGQSEGQPVGNTLLPRQEAIRGVDEIVEELQGLRLEIEGKVFERAHALRVFQLKRDKKPVERALADVDVSVKLIGKDEDNMPLGQVNQFLVDLDRPW